MSGGFREYLEEAKKVEDKDQQQFALCLKKAIQDARRIENSYLPFIVRWRRLVRFHLAIFDIHAALAVSRRARKLRLPGAERQVRGIEALSEEIGQFERWIVAARDDLRAIAAIGERIYPPGHVAVFMPHFSASSRRADIRKALVLFIEALEGNGYPYTIFGRLNNHGTPSVPPEVNFVSHHTIGRTAVGLHFKVTDRPHCFSVDPEGYSGWSEFAHLSAESVAAVDEKEAAKQFEDDRQAIVERNVSKYAQPDVSSPAVGKPWIFVALQTIDDAVQQLANVPMLEMLAEVAEVGQALNIPVVVKRHPKCTADAVTKALNEGRAAGKFDVSIASIHQLVEGSCAVCTVNSSVGAEALLHLKPVYLFGRADYQFACFRVTTRGAFSAMFKPNDLPVSESEIRKFLYLFRSDYSQNVNSPLFRGFVAAKMDANFKKPSALNR